MTRIDTPARASRTAARTERRRATGAGVLLAVLAVVAQTSLPHLHQWLAGAHGPYEVARVSAAAATIADDSGTHGEAGCAICRAIAQSRVYLATAAPAPAMLLAAASPAGDHARRTLAPLPVAHAPRSPPLAT
jgi:hypothetical protein